MILAKIGKTMDYGKILDEVGNCSDNGEKTGYAIGDTVIVYSSLHEGDREVQQKFKGIVIADKGRAENRSITVRNISHGVGLERVFPINSPIINKIDILKRGQVTKAKLYHIRDLKGKAATNIQEKKFVPRPEKKE